VGIVVDFVFKLNRVLGNLVDALLLKLFDFGPLGLVRDDGVFSVLLFSWAAWSV